MAYKMKGSPAKLGAIQGTAGHRAAVKEANSPNKHIAFSHAGASHTLKSHAQNLIADPIGTVRKAVTGKMSTTEDKRTYKQAKDAAIKDGKTTFMWRSKRHNVESSPTKHLIGKHPSKKDGHVRADHKAIKLNKDMQKRDKMKDEGKTVEDSRTMRRVQNRINRKMDSKVRHKKNIFTGGKYKRKIVK